MKYTFNDKDHCAHQDWLPYEYRKVHEGSGGTTVALEENSHHASSDCMSYDTHIRIDKERT